MQLQGVVTLEVFFPLEKQYFHTQRGAVVVRPTSVVSLLGAAKQDL